MNTSTDKPLGQNINSIEINNLSFKFDQTAIINDLSFSIKSGQLVCLLGENGSGKSTLINLMLNRLKPENGEIKILGYDDINQVKLQMGVMLQNSTAPDKATVKELINLFSSYYESPYCYEKLVSLLNLTKIQHKRFHLLSGGQKQIVLFSLALCGNPKILFLDEPTVAMDIYAKRILFNVIENLKKEGKTIFLTTHNLGEAENLSDRIMVLKNGKIIADNTPEKIKSIFENKIIKAISSKSETWIKNLPSVKSIEFIGRYVHVTSYDVENTLKFWLANDDSINDIYISSTNLEQAFINITNQKEF